MLIPVECNSCGFRFKVHARFAGKRGTCPNPDCAREYVVPQTSDGGGSPILNRNRPQPSKQQRHVGRNRSVIAAGVIATAMLLLIAIERWGVAEKSSKPASQSGNKNAADVTSLSKASDARKKQFETDVRPFLKKYCIDCHGPMDPEGEVSLNALTNEATAHSGLATWEKVIAVLEAGAMPPEDHEQRPTDDERKRVLKWIDRTFFNIDCNLVRDPGRVTIRRLNRAEYNNTIRDLVGVDFKPADDFPSDDVGYGFDNIGDVLSLPPLLMEKYLTAAERITEAAIYTGDPSKLTVQHREAAKLEGKNASEVRGRGFRTLSSTGAVFGEFSFELEGEYIVRAEAAAEQAGPEPARMEFRLDGQKLEVHDIQGHRKPGVYESRVKIGMGTDRKPGKKRLAAWFINDFYNPKAKNRKDRDRNLHIGYLEVEGPIGLKEYRYPETHTRIVFVKPGPDKPAEQAARAVLQKFATRAFRRPVGDDELEGMLRLFQMAAEEGESFERGIQLAVQAVLVSPHFLFRVESDAAPNDVTKRHRIGPFELASRLSYFLWSSMPDEELFSLAKQGVLFKTDVLRRQVKRMLKDPKSQALVENFAGQWLNLRNLDEATPDPKRFPTFNEQLRADMRRETELLFEAVMREDRSILDFLDADFTFLNERLAGHYGIPDVKGDEFRKVVLANSQRAGVLTHASILTLTSDPMRTLPVKRGKWILENILGTPPPPPPPGVPELAETQKANPDATLRKQFELHRSNPTCASCHKLMDPLGLGFENFDAIGRWRDKDGGLPIDSAGTLPGGETFNSPLELVKLLKKQKEKFSRHLAGTMLTYALGRGLEFYDKCAVDRMTKVVAENGYRFGVLVLEVVRSDPFLMRRGDGGKNE